MARLHCLQHQRPIRNANFSIVISMGRRKIEIQPLTDDRNRTVTFVKRKAGLFKKAHELAVLCQVDLAVIIVGNNNKLYEFSSVDTQEILDVYKSTTKPHESKSPANYGNYKKRKHLAGRTGVIHDDDVEEEDDEDYDSDTPEPVPKRAKSSSRPIPPNHISLLNVPTFGGYHSIKEEEEEEEPAPLSGLSRHKEGGRPVLRVQIPIDAKNSSNDSARTVTAMETQGNTGLTPAVKQNNDESDSGKSSGSNQQGPSLNTPKFSSFGTFRSPATAKHIPALPVPIHKSQTSSPQLATAPSLPSGIPMFYTLPQRSPSSQYPLQTPIYNPMFEKYRAFGPTSGGPGAAGAGAGAGSTGAAGASSGPTSTGTGTGTGTSAGNGTTSGSGTGPVNGSNPGSGSGPNDPPMLGLPSRYVNDIFPSPYNFYAPQDWPQSSTGLTPFHNLPQYFLMPQSRGGSLGGPYNQNSSNNQQGQLNENQPPPQLPPPSVVQQQQQPSQRVPSPLQFMGQQFSPNEMK